MIPDDANPTANVRSSTGGGLTVARVALLDDYQGVALSMADWKSLPAGTEVQAFEDHLADEGALADLNAAVEYLKRLPSVNASRIGIIGVCQSGRQSLLLPANRNDIAGAVVLYGAIGGREWQGNELRPTPVEELVAKVSCPVLGAFGEADHIISVDDVMRFRNCFEKAKKSYHIRLYRDAPHGWLNDTMPGRYRKEAANDAWKLMMAFLKKCFAGGWDKDRIVCTFESDYSAKYDFSKNVRME